MNRRGHGRACNPHLVRLSFTGLSGEAKHLLQPGKANKSGTLGKGGRRLFLLLLFIRETAGFREVFTICNDHPHVNTRGWKNYRRKRIKRLYTENTDKKDAANLILQICLEGANSGPDGYSRPTTEGETVTFF